LVLNAFKDRKIRIVIVNNEPKAEISINGEKAYLSSVYVSASNALLPKVSYLILKGVDICTGTEVSEKILIGKSKSDSDKSCQN
jgi:hypothetical protein